MLTVAVEHYLQVTEDHHRSTALNPAHRDTCSGTAGSRIGVEALGGEDQGRVEPHRERGGEVHEYPRG
jgi:hypothetical protein